MGATFWISLGTLVIGAAQLVFLFLVFRTEEPPVTPRHIHSRKCKCHRTYSFYDGDPDPGECHNCKIRKS